MKTNLLLILFTILFLSCSTRTKQQTSLKVNVKKEVNSIPYYLKIYEADSLYYIKNFKGTYLLLDKLFKEFKPLKITSIHEYSLYTKSGILLNKNIDFKKRYIDLIANYGYTQEILKNDSILNIGLLKSKITFKEYDSLRNKYLSKLDFKLRNEIIEMCRLDQFYRTIYDEGDRKEKMIAQDKKNQKKLIILFDKNIYPNEKIIGSYSIDRKDIDITTILLHTNDSIRKSYFLPKILKFVKNGKCEPIVYGAMIDQLQLYNDKEQIYGTYNIRNISSKDYKKFNLLRKSIGLPSIQYELQKLKSLGIY